ncbi:hypothetical protein [Acetilactobacillus jinshanensis]|uniref:Uncharacterized protein n=1 Tax=Acetilactobacillus jinshanensis TaxID=1720083 RepID=A0A4P6ZLN7_9LACO|nr:hypothetical protein [Acetilactobacillus jinshanensis]QBP18608.1 hypothetical protein ELX58_05570 [Acetilactobacillus jinshanensis]URL61484.1 hypothetical protein HGK75_05710 [uncultured bacterium]
MKLLQPDILKKLIQHDKSVTFAINMLDQHWSNVIAKYGPQTKIDAPTVVMAKQLADSGCFSKPINFNNYAEVQKYLIRNDVYMGVTGKQELLKPFKE